MKRILGIAWTLAVVVFFVDWIAVGFSIANGNYEITLGIYVGACCLLVILSYPFYKLLGDQCPHCGRILTSGGKYCPYCGKGIPSKLS